MTQVLGSLPAEDLSAITEIGERFVERVVAGDFAGAAALYTPDATLMPPHHPAASGRAAIAEFLASLPRVSRFTLDVDSIDGRADLAYVRGRWAATFETPGGPVADFGKYIEIRRRQADGSWLMESDIFNSDLPEAGVRSGTTLLSDTDRAAIARVREAWIAAMHEDRIDGLVTPLTDDTMAFPPHETPISGAAETHAWHQARAEQFTTRIAITVEEVVGGGDWALERLSYAIRLTPRAGGAPIENRGPCFWVYRRDSSGSWRIARAIWNDAAPLAANA